jgi:hypothetical protein
MEENFPPTARAVVVDGPARDRQARHFFKAKGLGTELQVIVGVPTAGAVLVLNGVRGVGVVLDDIGLANKSKPVGPNGKSTLHPDSFVQFTFGEIDLLVGQSAPQSVEVLTPDRVQSLSCA